MKSKAIAVTITVVLVAGLAAPLLFQSRKRAGKGTHLERYLPMQVDGWTAKTQPLGVSEAGTEAVKEKLQFDDYAYLSYSRRGVEFAIYVAYWNPGKPARGLAGGHTPDTCWRLAGCKPLARKSEFVLEGTGWPPTEWRRFEMPDGRTTEVVFWHSAGGTILHFDQHSIGSWLRDAARELGVAGEEQYFLRISSEQPIASLLADAGFLAATKEIGRLVFAGNLDRL